MAYTPVARRTTREGMTANDEFHVQGKRGKAVCLPVDSIESAREIRAYYGKDAFRIVYHDPDSAYIVVGNAEAQLISNYSHGRIVE